MHVQRMMCQHVPVKVLKSFTEDVLSCFTLYARVRKYMKIHPHFGCLLQSVGRTVCSSMLFEIGFSCLNKTYSWHGVIGELRKA